MQPPQRRVPTAGTLLSPPQDRSRSLLHPVSLPPLLGTRRHPEAAWSPPGPGPHWGFPGDPTRRPTQGQWVERPVDSRECCVHHQTVLAAHRLPLKGTDPSPGSPHCCAEPCLHGGRRQARGAEALGLAQGLRRLLLTRGCDHTRLHSVCALPVCAHTVCACTLAHAFRPVRTRGMLSHAPAPHVHVWAGSPQGRACPCTHVCVCMHTHIHVRALRQACAEAPVLLHTHRAPCSVPVPPCCVSPPVPDVHPVLPTHRVGPSPMLPAAALVPGRRGPSRGCHGAAPRSRQQPVGSPCALSCSTARP